MAENYPEITKVDSIELYINTYFDDLLLCVNERRKEILFEYREKKRKRESDELSRSKMLKQLNNAKIRLNEEIIENELQSTWEKMVGELEAKAKELDVGTNIEEIEIQFECEMREAIECISRLGQVVERKLFPIPEYSEFKSPRISVCKQGSSQGELDWPQAIAYDVKKQHIYVVDRLLNIESGRICVFTEEGDYVNTFGVGKLERPVGIAIGEDEVYVSDVSLNVVFHFSLPDFRLVAIVGKYGPSEDECYSPRQLTVAPDGDVYIADRHNNKIIVMDRDLKFKNSIKHDTMAKPKDLKILDDKLYVLSWSDNPCMHVFTKNGYKIRSFITRGFEGNDQIRQGHYFCFDGHSNLLISDYEAGAIKVFSQEGTLLHILGNSPEKRNAIKPKGIFVTPNNKIVCTSDNALHIFF